MAQATHTHWLESIAPIAMAGFAAFILMAQSAVPGNCFMISMPPERCDHAPTRPFSTRAVDHLTVDATCRSYANFNYLRVHLQACSITFIDHAILIISNDINPDYTACLVRHEYGHLNGWDAGHHGARYLNAPSTGYYQSSTRAHDGY